MNQQPSEDLNGELAPEFSETDDIELLKQALADEREKSAANLEGWQRAQADFTNYKRRIEQESSDIRQFANSTLILNLLPVLDDFERALNTVPDDLAEQDWTSGVRLIERKINALLEAQGVSPIKALGEPFDPHFHEAVMQDKGKEGLVVQEIQKGYKLHDKVLRPSKVVVGSGEEDEQGG